MIKTVAVALVFALLGIAAAQARPFTAKDMAMLDRVSDPHVSPDGRFVAYNVRSTDWEANRAWNALWVLDRSAPAAPPRLIREHEPGGTSPRWSADGRWLYFLSSRSGSPQVWRAAAGSAEATEVTALPLDVAVYRLTPDGRTLVVAVDIDPTCTTLACGKAKQEAKAKVKADGTVYDGATPRFWDTYLDGRFMSLFAVPLSDGAPASEGVALTPGYKADIISRPEGDDSAFAIAPDSQALIFGPTFGLGSGTGRPGQPLPRQPPHPWAAHAIRLVADDVGRLAGGVTRRISPGVPYPDRIDVHRAARAKLMVRDLASGAVRELAAGLDRSFGDIAWSPDGATLYAMAEDVGQERLYAVDVASGAAKPLTGDGHVGAIDVAKGVLDLQPRRARLPVPGVRAGPKPGPASSPTSARPPWRKRRCRASSSSASPAGTARPCTAMWSSPTGYQPGDKYPVAFLIHGGPHGSFGNAWSYRWNPQVWAGMGYAVVMVDFHGSTGYGEAFAKSIVGHWGDRPLEDLQKGWAAALAHYPYLDGDRACALGGSLRRLHDRLDRRQLGQALEVPGRPRRRLRRPPDGLLHRHPGLPAGPERCARPGRTRQHVERFNPIDHVADWTDPILVVHSGRDDRVPLDQGMGAYGAAQLRHVPSELLYFPDENHWVLKPQNSVQWYATVEAWMKRWLDAGSSAAAR